MYREKLCASLCTIRSNKIFFLAKSDPASFLRNDTIQNGDSNWSYGKNYTWDKLDKCVARYINMQCRTRRNPRVARCTVMARFCLAVTPRKSRWKPYYTGDVVQQRGIPGRLAQFSRRSRHSRHSRLSPPRHQKLFRGRVSLASTRTASPSTAKRMRAFASLPSLSSHGINDYSSFYSNCSRAIFNNKLS